ncbi:MAG: glycosyltransferase family 39 protein [Actinomycetota bacterium]|nr:glycosyltransferase family 39 protein [Actinomycetota bacterium]
MALVGALTALAAAARFAGIGDQSYWYDEAHTVWILHFSFAEMLAHVRASETTPPFYFMLACPWAHLFGYGEAGLRSLSALAGIATVPVAYAAGAKLVSRRTGMILAALTACSPLLVWYSREARSYAVLVLLTAVTLLAFANLRARPTRGWAITWTVASALALATHYYAALVVVPEAIWLLTHYRHDRVIRLGLGGVAVSLSALALFGVEQLRTLGPNNWINASPLAGRVGDVPKAFAIGPAAPVGAWLLAFGISVGIGGWLVMTRADARERIPIFFVARLVAAGVAFVIVLIVLGFDQVNPRNLIPLWLPVALVNAGCLGVRRAGTAGTVAAAVLCVLGIALVIGVAVDGRLQRPDWSGVAHALGSRPARAIFAVNGCQLLPLSLYVPGLHFARADGAVVSEVDVIVAAEPDWYTVCYPQNRAPIIPRRLGRFREIGALVQVGQFRVFRLRSAYPVRLNQRTFGAAGLRGALMIQNRRDHAFSMSSGERV